MNTSNKKYQQFEKTFEEKWDEKTVHLLDKNTSEELYHYIQKEIQPRRKKHFIYLAVATSFLLFISSFFLFKTWYSESTTDFITIKAPDSKKEVTLPDETNIVLYNGELTYPTVFVQQKREIQLNGKAFFDVTKDSLSPFIIVGQNIIIEVLGTSFMVDESQSELESIIQVKTGMVKVSSKENTNHFKFLKEKESVVFDFPRLAFEKIDSIKSFKTKKEVTSKEIKTLEQYEITIDITNLKIQDIFNKIERNSNYIIQHKTTLDTSLFISLPYKKASIQKILYDLSKIYGFKFKQKEYLIEIQKD